MFSKYQYFRLGAITFFILPRKSIFIYSVFLPSEGQSGEVGYRVSSELEDS